MVSLYATLNLLYKIKQEEEYDEYELDNVITDVEMALDEQNHPYHELDSMKTLTDIVDART